MNGHSLTKGRYSRDSLIGLGGVAKVHFGFDTILNQQVALKEAHGGDSHAADALKSEFRFAMTHYHPTLLNPIAIINDSGSPAIVMPYIKDFRLGDSSLQGKAALFNQMPDVTVRSFMAEILECAAFIHFNGYIYNDFKPVNFIFGNSADENGIERLRPVLLDFNLVSKAGCEPSRGGTIEYISPEVLQGESPSAASDIYSIGATLFELFTGSPPFESQENPALIKLITEEGILNLEKAPEKYRKGIATLLARDPGKRPRDARSAAAALGIENLFSELLESRAGYYLSSGQPPFADELLRAVREYIRGKPGKVFVSIGPGGEYHWSLDYLASELSADGYHIERIRDNFDEEIASKILSLIEEIPGAQERSRTVLLIEDLLSLSVESRQLVRALLHGSKFTPVIAGGKRWLDYGIPCCQFDPLAGRTAQNTTAEVLKSFLKSEKLTFDTASICLATGGDPELVYYHLKEGIKSGQLNLLSLGNECPISPELNLEIIRVMERATGILDTPKSSLLALLSAWGNSIPLILLAELDSFQMELVDALISTGHLQRGKNSIAFSSDDLRIFIYSQLQEKRVRYFHRFWAQAAEKYLSDNDELMEMRACHWGKSDDFTKGYEANFDAARELFKRSELSRARSYADELVSLSRMGGGSVSEAIKLYANILKQEGDYRLARSQYLQLLRLQSGETDNCSKAETYKDLGDLYRSMKKPRRALYYTGKALAIFGRLGNKQGVAGCHNNIGLSLWVSQEFEKALASFTEALNINTLLSNHQELAKIQSNIGIIKDILGKTSEVADYFENAFISAQKASDTRLEALIANNLGYFYIRQNDLNRAQGYLLKALDISQRIGYTESTINSLTNLGLCYLRLGELFVSIDYSQKAMEMAESIGSRHLALDSQLYLVEVSILMGNFSLSDSVLAAIEQDSIYAENPSFARQADLLRSWWHREIGNLDEAMKFANLVARFAAGVKDSRLELEAELAISLINMNENNFHALGELAAIVDKAQSLGHIDISDSAGLAIARGYLARQEVFNAERWIERVLERPGQTRKTSMIGRLLKGNLRMIQGKYNEAISICTDVETEAGSAGFIPHALDASAVLAEIYILCGKASKGQESAHRASTYAQRIIASLPQRFSPRDRANIPMLFRLTRIDEKIVEKNFVII